MSGGGAKEPESGEGVGEASGGATERAHCRNRAKRMVNERKWNVAIAEGFLAVESEIRV